MYFMFFVFFFCLYQTESNLMYFATCNDVYFVSIFSNLKVVFVCLLQAFSFDEITLGPQEEVMCINC